MSQTQRPSPDPEPTLGLEGTWNDRDVASLTGIKPGVLVRSAALHSLSQNDLLYLAELGLTDVIDLRSAREVVRDGEDLLPLGADIHPLPITAGAQLPGAVASATQSGSGQHIEAALAGLAQLISSGDAEAQLNAFMADTYAAIVSDPASQAQLGHGIRVIAHGTGAALVHCAAGKDRTGLLVAIALRTVGVAEEAIEADYLESNRHADLQGSIASLPGIDPGLLAPLRGVSLVSLHAAWAAIEAAFSTWDEFLTALDVSETDRDALKQRLQR